MLHNVDRYLRVVTAVESTSQQETFGELALLSLGLLACGLFPPLASNDISEVTRRSFETFLLCMYTCTPYVQTVSTVGPGYARSSWHPVQLYIALPANNGSQLDSVGIAGLQQTD